MKRKKRNPFNVIIGVAVAATILIFLLQAAHVVAGCQWIYLAPLLIAGAVIGVILSVAAGIAWLSKL